MCGWFFIGTALCLCGWYVLSVLMSKLWEKKQKLESPKAKNFAKTCVVGIRDSDVTIHHIVQCCEWGRNDWWLVVKTWSHKTCTMDSLTPSRGSWSELSHYPGYYTVVGMMCEQLLSARFPCRCFSSGEETRTGCNTQPGGHTRVMQVRSLTVVGVAGTKHTFFTWLSHCSLLFNTTTGKSYRWSCGVHSHSWYTGAGWCLSWLGTHIALWSSCQC